MFVLPTRFGMLLLALVLLLYILGTNYQNNLIMLLAYLLLVLWLTCIVQVYLNLHRWQLVSPDPLACFAGDSLLVPISLQPPANTSGQDQHKGFQPGQRSTEATSQALQPPAPAGLQARWMESKEPWLQWQPAQLGLALAMPKRGRYRLPRLAIQSVHPFGLMRCWAYLQLDTTVWVYPKPAAQFTDTRLRNSTGAPEEWVGLQSWRPGAAIGHIDWKRYARDQQMRVHQYDELQAPQTQIWLSFNPALTDLESQLSDLTAQVLAADAQQQRFGVRLPGKTLAPGRGPAHIQQILQVLAVW